jgi:ribose-phosphate pyrophosphokinase
MGADGAIFRGVRSVISQRRRMCSYCKEGFILISHGKDIKIFAGNANKPLAESICRHIGIRLGDSVVTKFSDGEISVSLYESVRGSDVFIIQSTCQPVNDNLMELLIMVDACKRASAGRITAVVPYFGYARQDRKAKARDPISAKLVANLITSAGADRVLTMDLHASQIQGFFDIPVDNLLGSPLFAEYYANKFGEDADDVVVVSPDVGSVSRARTFALKLGLGLAIIDKRREKANQSEVMNIIGDVRGKDVILYDDMVDTAGSLVGAAKALVESGGARTIYACATHGVLSGPAISRVNDSYIKELIFTDTIPYPGEVASEKIKYISAAPLFAEAIDRVYEEVSISTLFR